MIRIRLTGLAELAEDIKENGQISPCLIHQLDGKKIILAGRNRKKACELADVKVACILMECDDATAPIKLKDLEQIPCMFNFDEAGRMTSKRLSSIA